MGRERRRSSLWLSKPDFIKDLEHESVPFERSATKGSIFQKIENEEVEFNRIKPKTTKTTGALRKINENKYKKSISTHESISAQNSISENEVGTGNGAFISEESTVSVESAVTPTTQWTSDGVVLKETTSSKTESSPAGSNDIDQITIEYTNSSKSKKRKKPPKEQSPYETNTDDIQTDDILVDIPIQNDDEVTNEVRVEPSKSKQTKSKKRKKSKPALESYATSQDIQADIEVTNTPADKAATTSDGEKRKRRK